MKIRPFLIIEWYDFFKKNITIKTLKDCCLVLEEIISNIIIYYQRIEYWIYYGWRIEFVYNINRITYRSTLKWINKLMTRLCVISINKIKYWIANNICCWENIKNRNLNLNSYFCYCKFASQSTENSIFVNSTDNEGWKMEGVVQHSINSSPSQFIVTSQRHVMHR